MPQVKFSKVKGITVKEQEMIRIVDSDTLALTIIELFNDERVMKKMSDGLCPRELVEETSTI